MELAEFTDDFAGAIRIADSRRPQAMNARAMKISHSGIGPHSESETIQLASRELEAMDTYRGRIHLDVPYPDQPGKKCDICIGKEEAWKWSIEVSMIRFLGDRGRFPYPPHRNTAAECQELFDSGFPGRKAVVIFGYGDDERPVAPGTRIFERFAAEMLQLSHRWEARFFNLVHPVHQSGQVNGWEVLGTKTPNEEIAVSVRFGVDGGVPRTPEEIEESFEVTRKRIRQIEAKALEELSRKKKK